MIKHNQSGAVSSVVVSLILTVLLLIGAIAFAGWAFSSRQDYKNNVDVKINAAVGAAKQQQAAVDQAQFNEAAKQPLKTYEGPEQYGSLVVAFPKTWSAYVNNSGGSSLVDGYFAPGVVPSTSDRGSVFALRVQVISQAYAQVLGGLNTQLRSGGLTSKAYALPKVPSAVGVEVSGQLVPHSPSLTMVILPLRSNTLEIWTQGNQYLNDFNNNILANFTFSP